MVTDRKHQFSSCMMVLCIVTACGSKSTQWDNVDYTPVYKAYEKRQNDAGYTQPSVVGCVDDDLYNCK